jgi:hypothetical protein
LGLWRPMARIPFKSCGAISFFLSICNSKKQNWASWVVRIYSFFLIFCLWGFDIPFYFLKSTYYFKSAITSLNPAVAQPVVIVTFLWNQPWIFIWFISLHTITNKIFPARNHKLIFLGWISVFILETNRILSPISV